MPAAAHRRAPAGSALAVAALGVGAVVAAAAVSVTVPDQAHVPLGRAEADRAPGHLP